MIMLRSWQCTNDLLTYTPTYDAVCVGWSWVDGRSDVCWPSLSNHHSWSVR